MLPPHQQAMLVRGTKAKELAMAEALKNSIAFVGIDIGKNSFHVVGHPTLKFSAEVFPLLGTSS